MIVNVGELEDDDERDDDDRDVNELEDDDERDVDELEGDDEDEEDFDVEDEDAGVNVEAHLDRAAAQLDEARVKSFQALSAKAVENLTRYLSAW